MWSLFGYADPEPDQDKSGGEDVPEPDAEEPVEAETDPTSEQPETPSSAGGGFWSWFGYNDQPEVSPAEKAESLEGPEAPAKQQEDVPTISKERSAKKIEKSAIQKNERKAPVKKGKKKKEEVLEPPAAASSTPSRKEKELPGSSADVAATRMRLQLIEAAAAERQKLKEEKAAEKKARRDKLEHLLSEVSRTRAEVEEARASLRSSSASTTKSVESLKDEHAEEAAGRATSQDEEAGEVGGTEGPSDKKQRAEKQRRLRAEAKAKREALRREQQERLERLLEERQQSLQETARSLQQAVLDQRQQAAQILLQQQQVLAAAEASSARSAAAVEDPLVKTSPAASEAKAAAEASSLAALEKAASEQAARFAAEKKAALLEARLRETEAKAAQAEKKALEAERRAEALQKEEPSSKPKAARIFPKLSTPDEALRAEAASSPLHVVFRGFPLELSRNLFKLQKEHSALQETVREKEKLFAEEMERVDDEIDKKLRAQAEAAERATRKTLMISQGLGKLSEYYKASTIRLQWWALNTLMAATRAEREGELMAKEAAVKAAEAAAAEEAQKFRGKHKKGMYFRSGLLIIEHLCKDRMAAALSCWLRCTFDRHREEEALPGLVGDLSDERVRLSIAALACAREASLKAEQLTAAGGHFLEQKQAALGAFFQNKFRDLKGKEGEKGEWSVHTAKLEDLTLGSYLARWRRTVTDESPPVPPTTLDSDPDVDSSMKYNVVAQADPECVQRVARLVAAEMSRLRVETLADLNLEQSNAPP